LYPLFTFIKDSNHLKGSIAKLGTSLGILIVAYFLTNIYLMDMSSGKRELNLYEVMEIHPQDFMSMEKNDFKRQYRDLAKKWHPDKNTETDTTEIYMKIKQAYEIIMDESKRVAYDVYGQTDFTMDDRMKSMVE
jgi:preprotein translocase subunit Sec63